jgi:hypothetical protein
MAITALTFFFPEDVTNRIKPFVDTKPHPLAVVLKTEAAAVACWRHHYVFEKDDYAISNVSWKVYYAKQDVYLKELFDCCKEKIRLSTGYAPTGNIVNWMIDLGHELVVEALDIQNQRQQNLDEMCEHFPYMKDCTIQEIF